MADADISCVQPDGRNGVFAMKANCGNGDAEIRAAARCPEMKWLRPQLIRWPPPRMNAPD
jgi:hypothetical protein